MRARHILFGVLVILVVVILAGLGFVTLAWESEIAAIKAPAKTAFDLALMKKGAELATIGNCNVCHTAKGGRPYAGGRALTTPFGTIYATNITPDPDTGIGRWSEQALHRAMRHGVNREGQHLYPAFPYDHFTTVTNDDIKAIYAFLMTRDPVRQESPPNDLRFPLNFRPVIAGWKLLYLQNGVYQPDPTRRDELNRGAYLVEGLAHCGACHTPRNRLGAERRGRYLAGGFAEGWYAPPLNAQSAAPVAWNAEALFIYLRGGWDEAHGAAGGPMATVTHNLAKAPEADVRAIAAYVASVLGAPAGDKPQRPEDVVARVADRAGTNTELVNQEPGAAMFAGACATCHADKLARGSARGINLALSTAVNGPDPRNAIRAILDGIGPLDQGRSPYMPGFATTFTDEQMAHLLAYVRWRFTTQPAWTGVEERVRRIRAGAEQS
jgi:mono/diheme cytochrome c family protein